MLHRLILKVTKLQLSPPKRLSTAVKNILGGIMRTPPPPCQIGLRHEKQSQLGRQRITMKSSEVS